MWSRTWSEAAKWTARVSIGSGGAGLCAHLVAQNAALTASLAGGTALIGLVMAYLVEREHTRRAALPYAAEITLAEARARALDRAARAATSGPSRTKGAADQRRAHGLEALEQLRDTDRDLIEVLRAPRTAPIRAVPEEESSVSDQTTQGQRGSDMTEPDVASGNGGRPALAADESGP